MVSSSKRFHAGRSFARSSNPDILPRTSQRAQREPGSMDRGSDTEGSHRTRSDRQYSMDDVVYTHRVSTPFDSTEPLSAIATTGDLFSSAESRSNSRRQRPPWGTKRVVGRRPLSPGKPLARSPKNRLRPSANSGTWSVMGVRYLLRKYVKAGPGGKLYCGSVNNRPVVYARFDGTVVYDPRSVWKRRSNPVNLL